MLGAVRPDAAGADSQSRSRALTPTLTLALSGSPAPALDLSLSPFPFSLAPGAAGSFECGRATAQTEGMGGPGGLAASGPSGGGRVRRMRREHGGLAWLGQLEEDHVNSRPTPVADLVVPHFRGVAALELARTSA